MLFVKPKFTIALLLLSLASFSFTPLTHAIAATSVYQPKPAAADLNFLKKYAGKYPHDVKLLSNATLTMRLRKLLGPRYAYLKKTWSVETPIEIRDNVFTAAGCEAHNCSATNFIIAVDFSTNVLYAGIRQEEKTQVYAEDGSSNKRIMEWQQRK